MISCLHQSELFEEKKLKKGINTNKQAIIRFIIFKFVIKNNYNIEDTFS